MTLEGGDFGVNVYDCKSQASLSTPCLPAVVVGGRTAGCRDKRHYFLTANQQEAQQIDAGAAGPGWTRTNRSFKAYQGIQGSPTSPAIGIACRFYGTPGRGPNSHFYTAFAGECNSVQQDPGWRLEDPEAFAILLPIRMSPCNHPVYRAYNNRAVFNDSNHRYMTETSDYNAMVAAGWIGEGPVFCAIP